MSTTKLRIAISVGELSGDEHGAKIVQALTKLRPEIELGGMVGRNLVALGVKQVVDMEKSASVMGFTEVLKSLGKILAALKTMKQFLVSWKPDLLILIDYPDFNLKLAKFAALHSIPVLYFIPPSIWAWRSGRIELIKKYVSRVALIYPFEKEFYVEHSYDRAVYVGHPFADNLANWRFSESEQAAWRAKHGLKSDQPLVAVFPGSRHQEIERHLMPVKGAIELLRAKHPKLQFALALAPSIDEQLIRQKLGASFNLTIIKDDSISLLKFSTAAILKSGTSNLQAAFTGTPFMMFYQASKLTELIVKLLVRVNQYSIVNLIRPQSILELTQDQVTPNNIAREVESLVYDHRRNQYVRGLLREVVLKLNSSDQTAQPQNAQSAYERVAILGLDLVRDK